VIPGTIPIPGGGLPTISSLGSAIQDANATTFDLDINFGTGAGNDLYAVGVVFSAGSNRTVSSVTLDPSGANLSATKRATSGTSEQSAAEIWGAVGNLSGTKTVRVTMSGTTDAAAIAVQRIRGQSSATPTDTDAQRLASDTSNTLSVDVAADGVIFAIGCKFGSSNITLTGVTEISEAEFRGDNDARLAYGSAADQPSATGKSVSMSWTTSSGTNFAVASWR
jgi:hypothetical protein